MLLSLLTLLTFTFMHLAQNFTHTDSDVKQIQVSSGLWHGQQVNAYIV